MDFTIYQISDGRILRYGTCPQYDKFLQCGDGEMLHEGEQLNDMLWYLPGGVKTPRPVFEAEEEHTIAADGVDAVGFPLPPGSQVYCQTTGEYWPDESEFFFSTEAVGTMVYRIEPAFPYQENVRVVIHAA